MQFSLYGLGNFRTQGAGINNIFLSFNISEQYLPDKETLSKMCICLTVSGNCQERIMKIALKIFWGESKML
jgi:hypothetical protein